MLAEATLARALYPSVFLHCHLNRKQYHQQLRQYWHQSKRPTEMRLCEPKANRNWTKRQQASKRESEQGRRNTIYAIIWLLGCSFCDSPSELVVVGSVVVVVAAAAVVVVVALAC